MLPHAQRSGECYERFEKRFVKASDNISSIENLILTNNDFDIDAKNRLKKMFRHVGKLIL